MPAPTQVTASTCTTLYKIPPYQRSFLPYRRRRTRGGLMCKLYSLPQVLRLARRVHLNPRARVDTKVVRALCAALGVNVRAGACKRTVLQRLAHFLQHHT